MTILRWDLAKLYIWTTQVELVKHVCYLYVYDVLNTSRIAYNIIGMWKNTINVMVCYWSRPFPNVMSGRVLETLENRSNTLSFVVKYAGMFQLLYYVIVFFGYLHTVVFLHLGEHLKNIVY